MDQTPSSNIML